MPSPGKTVSSAQKSALFECFREASALVPAALRREFILVSGAASVTYSSRLWTDNIDIAASTEAIVAFRQAIAKRKRGSRFQVNSCEIIEFNSRLGFKVTVELLQLGGPFVESIIGVVPFQGGFVASLADLVLNRIKTVIARGEPGDITDVKFLLEEAARRGTLIPCPEAEHLRIIKPSLTICEWLLLGALLA